MQPADWGQFYDDIVSLFGQGVRPTQSDWAAKAQTLCLSASQASSLAAATYGFLSYNGRPDTRDEFINLATHTIGPKPPCSGNSGSSGGSNGGSASGGSSGNGSTSTGGSSGSSGSSSSLLGSGGLMDWITANPLLAAGGAAGVAFLLFSRRRR